MGGRGSSSGMRGGGGGAKSPISTGGVMRQESADQWFGANDNGSYAVINYAGVSDYNFYQYGNKRIYEVDRGLPEESLRISGVTNPPRLYAYTKSEAMQYAKGWLKANKGR